MDVCKKLDVCLPKSTQGELFKIKGYRSDTSVKSIIVAICHVRLRDPKTTIAIKCGYNSESGVVSVKSRDDGRPWCVSTNSIVSAFFTGAEKLATPVIVKVTLTPIEIKHRGGKIYFQRFGDELDTFSTDKVYLKEPSAVFAKWSQRMKRGLDSVLRPGGKLNGVFEQWDEGDGSESDQSNEDDVFLAEYSSKLFDYSLQKAICSHSTLLNHSSKQCSSPDYPMWGG